MNYANVVRRHAPKIWFYFTYLRYKYLKGERELRWFCRVVPKVNIAIDVGSSIGIWTKEMSRRARKVIAFEANPAVAAFARTVAPSNAEVINVALSSCAGHVTLRVPTNAKNEPITDLATIESRNSLPHENILTVDVAAQRLDDYEFPECGFIKIDVEGHEGEVIDGGMELIKRNRPVLMIELAERLNPGTVMRVTDRLAHLSYTVWFVSHDRLQPFDRSADVENIYNFFFLPKETARSLGLISDSPHGSAQFTSS